MIKYKGIQTSYSPTKEGLQTRNVMIEDTNIEKVYRISDDKIEDVELNFKRYPIRNKAIFSLTESISSK